LPKIISRALFLASVRNLFDCAASHAVLYRRGHADNDDDRDGNGNVRTSQRQHFPGARLRGLSFQAQQRPSAGKTIPKSLIKSGDHRIESDRCIMRTHDFVSDGFLAVTAAGFVLLCSSLLAAAFS
jgi:hypothetical protein